MADALAALRSAAPAAAAAAVLATGDAGGSRSQISQIITVLTAHERAIHTLEDRARCVFFLQTEEVRRSVLQVRDAWRQADHKRRDEHTKAYERAEEAGQPEPQMGALGSQRAVVFALLLEHIAAKIPADNAAAKEAAGKLVALGSEAVNMQVFRLKPEHDEPKPDKVWVWGLLFADDAAAEFRGALRVLYGGKFGGIDVRASHQNDGPTIRALLGQGKGKSKGKGKGKGRGAAGDDSDAEGRGSRKRRK